MHYFKNPVTLLVRQILSIFAVFALKMHSAEPGADF
jgi:hypothetical protein